MILIVDEIIGCTEILLSYFSGRIGTFLRMIWCQFRFPPLACIKVR